MKIIYMAMLCMVLTGCAAARQAELNKEIAAAKEQTLLQLTDKRLDPIRAKVSFPGNKVSVPTSLPDECPNENEKDAINTLRGILALEKATVSSLDSQFVVYDSDIVLTYLSSVDSNLGKLYRCELTFQTYAESGQRLRDMAEQDSIKLKQQVTAEERLRTQRALTAFGDAMQNVSNSIQQQEAMRQSNRPTHTRCVKNGSAIDCTTY